jgi:hypothetical protein
MRSFGTFAKFADEKNSMCATKIPHLVHPAFQSACKNIKIDINEDEGFCEQNLATWIVDKNDDAYIEIVLKHGFVVMKNSIAP